MLLIGSAIAIAMAFASSAPATTLTSPSGSSYWGKVQLASQGHITVHQESEVVTDIECNWSFTTEPTEETFSGTRQAALYELTVTECTDEWTAEVWDMGSMVFHSLHGGPGGTIIWSGAIISFKHHFWGTCRYVTYNTKIQLTGSSSTGGTAIAEIDGKLPFYSGSFICDKNAEWTGTFLVTSPDFLDVDGLPTIHAVAEEGFIYLDTEFSKYGEIVCQSTFENQVEVNESGLTAGGQISTFTLSPCYLGDAAIQSPGTLEIQPIGGGPDGTVVWSGGTVKASEGSVVCYYKANGIDFGTLTGSATTGGTATIDIDGSLPLESGDPLCDKQLQWTGSYTVETIDNLNVTA
ncbi:MAG TPA: hypothetical protein VFY75_05725 [Solirubrobacterales bacterium]|nr:hypothetical protein [Solirubrobacterales bacterium]